MVGPGTGDGGGLRRPRRPWSWRLGARGELSAGRNREGRGLALVEDGRKVLTSKGIRPRWPRRVDRRECSAFGKETEEKKLERGGSRAAQLGGSEGLRWWRRADWGAFYRRDEAVEEGAAVVAHGQLCSAPSMAWGQLRLLAGVAERRGLRGRRRAGACGARRRPRHRAA